MLDAHGNLIRLADRMTIGSGINGVVVFSIDTGEFLPEFPRSDWTFLGRGIGINTPSHGLFHHETANEDLEVVG